MAVNIRMPLLTDKQKQFVKDRGQHKYLCFGGSRGGGKSFTVRWDSVDLSLRYKDNVALIVRRTYPELYANHIKPLLKWLPVGSYKYNDSKKEFTFPNGSQIVCQYCSNDKDLLHFQGTEYDQIYIDEATQITEEQFRTITACLRGVNDHPHFIKLTCNPGGQGMAWVKRLFIDKQYINGENPDEYSFIQSGLLDNKALMKAQPDYIHQLEALPPKLREAWLYGNWDIYEGQFFEDFRPNPDLQAAHDHDCDDDPEILRRDGRWCHVIDPIDLSTGRPASWKIYRSYDFGYGKPFSCAWWAMDFDGTVYRIMELYGCTETPNEGLKWSPDQQFSEIARIEREHPWLKGKKIDGVADPAIWDASRGESIADMAIRHGVYFTPGDNNRIAGWMQCHYRLQFDDNGYPRMYVFSNCKGFIRTVPLMMYDDHKPEDLDTSLEDHICDEWRYFCMSRPVAPLKPIEQKQILSDPLNQFTKKRR